MDFCMQLIDARAISQDKMRLILISRTWNHRFNSQALPRSHIYTSEINLYITVRHSVCPCSMDICFLFELGWITLLEHFFRQLSSAASKKGTFFYLSFPSSLPHTYMKSEFVTNFLKVAELFYSMCFFFSSQYFKVWRHSILPWPLLSLAESLRHYWCFLQLCWFLHPIPPLNLRLSLQPQNRIWQAGRCEQGLAVRSSQEETSVLLVWNKTLSEYSLKLLLSKKISSLSSTTGISLWALSWVIPI